MGAPRWPNVALLVALATATALGCGSSAEPAPPRELAPRGPDKLRVELDLVHGRHTLSGRQAIGFRNPSTRVLDHVWLRVWDNAFGTCARPYVDVAALDGARIGERRRGCTALRVDLRTPVAPGERGSLRLRTVTLFAASERDFALVVGPMDVAERQTGGVRTRWFTPRGTAAGRATAGLRIATRGLAALQDDLGAYGAEELDILDAPPHVAHGAGVAMEYPQLILSPPYAPALVHEIAHQWLFRLVGDDEWSDPWVDETLASFAAMRTGRAVHGPDRLNGCVQHDRPATPPAPVDSSMGTLERLQRRRAKTTRDTLYIEGPCALFNLQRRIGEPRMTTFLRGLVARYRNGILTGRDLHEAIARLPTGEEAVRELRLAPVRPGG